MSTPPQRQIEITNLIVQGDNLVALKALLTYHAGRTRTKIRADTAFPKARAKRPKHIDEMTPPEKAASKKMLDCKFPPNPAVLVKAAKVRSVGRSTNDAENPELTPVNFPRKLPQRANRIRDERAILCQTRNTDRRSAAAAKARI